MRQIFASAARHGSDGTAGLSATRRQSPYDGCSGPTARSARGIARTAALAYDAVLLHTGGPRIRERLNFPDRKTAAGLVTVTLKATIAITASSIDVTAYQLTPLTP